MHPRATHSQTKLVPRASLNIHLANEPNAPAILDMRHNRNPNIILTMYARVLQPRRASLLGAGLYICRVGVGAGVGQSAHSHFLI